ncbi:MAG: DNA-formamidopyrimidine glycosylase family protein [Polyangiaceae bacterium]
MPELPDVAIYVEHLAARTIGKPLNHVRFASPFVLRTAVPPIREAEGRVVRRVFRLGKRIVFELDGDRFLVIHLMVAGRFRWLAENAKLPGKIGLAAFDFPGGTLALTEASTKKRAAIHFVIGEAAARELHRGGIEPLEISLEEFAGAVRRENHTLKRTLTDQRFLSGIGNAYSDEILFEAQLSPLKHSATLDDADMKRLYDATRAVLTSWVERLRAVYAQGFPEGVTAFREEMKVHGRYGKPCPRCGAPVQRIVHADNEINYCAGCQTGGKLLADRSLSRLLGKDWPKTLEELEDKRPAAILKPNPARSTRAPKKTAAREPTS